jgi:hypothetical protein
MAFSQTDVPSSSAAIRARLNHPIIDSDGRSSTSIRAWEFEQQFGNQTSIRDVPRAAILQLWRWVGIDL